MAYLEVLGKGQGAAYAAPENRACRRNAPNLPRPRSVQRQSRKPSTATERAAAKPQTFHGHRARGKRATGEAAEKAKLPNL